MMDVNDVLAQLNPSLRKRVTMGNEIPKTEFALTPSYGLNKALCGGLPYGRQVLIWGNKSAGKSSFCLQMIALAQKEGKVCAWIDAEMSFSPEWAERLGVDTSKLIVSETRTINGMVDVGIEFINAGVDIVVVDSISALLPAIYFDKKTDDLKQLEDTKQIGAESRDFSNAWKMINYANNKVKPTLFVIISQARNNIGAMYTQVIPQGGNATKFYSSTIVKLFSSESDAQALKGKIPVGDKLIEEKIGRKVTWTVQFSKLSPGFDTGDYNFYFRGPEVGLDIANDLVTTATQMGIIETSGKWFKYNEKNYNGETAMTTAVKEDESLMAELVEKVMNA